MKDQEIVTAFRKSSYSQGGQQECVEVAHTATGGRAVRDSKDPGCDTQHYSSAGWSAFIAGVKSGDFEN
ncbi:DUF397 domain-containing protein [Streptomyces kanamyceticus]|uniref:DUF397 domain-containing protein n=1 Tax=Streptomyces kanamyceticus TaxID=1967 RepID=A0A5J6GCT0_STRKN|nr:DUF397 domain-containing protein [Streptomyces kanamyceticus]QEU93700.1 DUF397 domain-containing protein [Streptomyces kanamyceticus]